MEQFASQKRFVHDFCQFSNIYVTIKGCFSVEGH